MSMLLKIAALFVLLNLCSAQIPDEYTVKWYTQKVDHASYSNNDTFQQRYIISTQHWKPNGPIFFYCGNEGDVFAFANNTGMMWENAPKYGAMVVFVEHRYYGESLPYGKKSFHDLDYLGFLSVEQALADFAQFLTDFKTTLRPDTADSPVMLFGGSYGGMLAAWFRMKYPHLSVGALAASAPILQFPGIYDCSKYERIATKNFEDYSDQCSGSIRKSWSAMRALGETNQGLKFLTETFNLCKPLDDINAFVAWVGSAWDSMAMTDYPNPANFLAPLPAYPIEHVCEHLKDSSLSNEALMKNIYLASNVYFNYTGNVKCNDISNSDNIGAMDGWNFQACTEMVLPVCADGKNDMFEPNPWNFTSYSANCKKTYGVGSDRDKAITLFGGKNLESVTNIIFSNGERDPWSAGGVLSKKHVNKDNLVLIIPHACHHEDLRWSGPNDSVALREIRRIELTQMRKWFEEFYTSRNVSYDLSEAIF